MTESSVDVPGAGEIRPGHRLEISTPSATAFAGVVRSTVAGVAARLDLDLDAVEDLRLAVSEAFALVVDHTVLDDVVRCVVVVEQEALGVTVSARVADPRPPLPDSFAWTVLSALVPGVEVEVHGEQVAVLLRAPLPA
jgi:serine/threonine-protein kinase RsbW